jgi:site-specific DNA-methyltransferase (adenine-specific)
MTRPDPYCAERNIQLYCGDCLDILPALDIDGGEGRVHVITDPPYGAEAHTKARRQSKGPGTLAEEHSIGFACIDEKTRTGIAEAANAYATGWVLAFCQVEAVATWRSAFTAAGLDWVRGQCWVKPDGTPQLTGDRPAQGFECIATAHPRGRKRWNGGGKRGVYTHPVNNYGRKESRHPTTKPIKLMHELVSLFTDPGELVLDPFAGSGTTLRACKDLGRRCIGIEPNPQYCEIAKQRLAQEVLCA